MKAWPPFCSTVVKDVPLPPPSLSLHFLSRDLESNLSVDWSCLGPEDEAKLATHLTQEHRGWLDHATSQRDDVEWEKRTEDDLRTVV